MLRKWGDDDRYFYRALWFPLSFALGAAGYFSLDNEPGFVIYLWMLSAVISGLFLYFRIRAELSALPQFLLIVMIWFAAGFGYSDLRTRFQNAPAIKESLDRVMVEGWIREIRSNDKRSRLTIDVHAISGVSAELTPKSVRLTQLGSPELRSGRFVRCFARVSPPPEPGIGGDYEFSRDAYFKSLGGVGFIYGKCRMGSLPARSSPWTMAMTRLSDARRQTATYINDEAGRGGGLAAALLTGDRSFISEADNNTLRNSGLAHLLAISGLHMGLAGGAFYFLFFRFFALIEPLAKRFPVQKLAAIAALSAVTGYLFFSGASISAQRAYVMVSIAFLAILMDRPAISFQTLGIAMLTVTLISPSAPTTPGFQMSFAAAAALVRAFAVRNITSPQSVPYLPGWLTRALAPILLTSVVAGSATTPFAVFHFGRVASMGMLANFVIMPVFTAICVPLAVISVIGMILGVGDIPLGMFGWSLALILQMAAFFADQNASASLLLEKPFPAISLCLTVIAMAYWILSERLFARGAIVFMLAAAFGWLAVPTRDVIVSETGHIAFRSSDGWTRIRMDDAGLVPLSFSNLPELRCRNGCTGEFKSGTIIVTEAGTLEIHMPSVADPFVVPSNRSMSFHIREDKFKTYDASYRKCRPWTMNWPQCQH